MSIRIPLAPADLGLLALDSVVPWTSLRDAQVLMTGCSGFVGSWMLSAVLLADERLDLGIRLHVLTRDPDAFTRRCQWLARDPRVQLFRGDVRDCAWPRGDFTHVIVGAAAADAAVSKGDPEATFETIGVGTRRTLDVAIRRNAQRVLLLSSGAVYARTSSGTPVDETASLCSDDPREAGAYHAGKRLGEEMALSAAQKGLAVSVARLFAFVGPLLPLDRHFAIGNFIADALGGGPVVVTGDGTPTRSYLYAADMALWAWAIFLQGTPGRAYNVGSERAVSIEETARCVAACVRPPVDVVVGGAHAPADAGGGGRWYVPSTRRAREELGLGEWTTLEEAVSRTVTWYRDVGV